MRLYLPTSGIGVDMRSNARAGAATACAVLVGVFLPAAHAAATRGAAGLAGTKKCTDEWLCEWGSWGARAAGISALGALTHGCPSEYTPLARYAARVLETQELQPDHPCPDLELARAFAQANATLKCNRLSPVPMVPLCENAHFLTPGMHGVVVVLLTLTSAQVVASFYWMY